MPLISLKRKEVEHIYEAITAYRESNLEYLVDHSEKSVLEDIAIEDEILRKMFKHMDFLLVEETTNE